MMNQSLTEFVQELRDSLPLPKLDRIIIERGESALYNIHKRGVPFTDKPLDKIIMIGLTRHEADKEMLKLIKRESKRRYETLHDNNKEFYHYDIVPMDAMVHEKSVFFNEGSPIL